MGDRTDLKLCIMLHCHAYEDLQIVGNSSNCFPKSYSEFKIGGEMELCIMLHCHLWMSVLLEKEDPNVILKL
jgi:hypothetical protein